MATTTKRAAVKAAQKTQSLIEQVMASAEQERRLAVDAEVEGNARYKTLTESIKRLRHDLHMSRLLVKRKDFAISVRERKLKEIPREIEAIKKARSKEVAKRQSLEQQLAAAQEGQQNIREETERRLQQENKLTPLPLAS